MPRLTFYHSRTIFLREPFSVFFFSLFVCLVSGKLVLTGIFMTAGICRAGRHPGLGE